MSAGGSEGRGRASLRAASPQLGAVGVRPLPAAGRSEGPAGPGAGAAVGAAGLGEVSGSGRRDGALPAAGTAALQLLAEPSLRRCPGCRLPPHL